MSGDVYLGRDITGGGGRSVRPAPPPPHAHEPSDIVGLSGAMSQTEAEIGSLRNRVADLSRRVRNLTWGAGLAGLSAIMANIGLLAHSRGWWGW